MSPRKMFLQHFSWNSNIFFKKMESKMFGSSVSGNLFVLGQKCQYLSSKNGVRQGIRLLITSPCLCHKGQRYYVVAKVFQVPQRIAIYQRKKLRYKENDMHFSRVQQGELWVKTQKFASMWMLVKVVQSRAKYLFTVYSKKYAHRLCFVVFRCG